MRLLLAIFLSLVLALSGRAQERVRNVRLQVADSSQIQIWYDLVEARPGDSVYVNVESRTRGALSILPEFIRGDIGKRITAGSNRRIVWDAVANGYPLNEEIRATVLVKTILPIAINQPTSASSTGTQSPNVTSTNPVTVTQPKAKDPEMPVVSVPVTPPAEQRNKPSAQPADVNRVATDSLRFRKRRYVGPAWALLSAVAPGIGNIFVQSPNPKVGFRPLVLGGTYSLLIYGLGERQKSRDDYALYEQQKNMTDGESYYQSANNHHHTYYLATRGAIAVAAIDVILTFVRGLRNNQIQRNSRTSQSVTWRPGIQAGQITAVVHYSF